MTETAVRHAMAAPGEDGQIVSFMVGKETFGVGIDRVKEIVRYPDITAVPRAPGYLTGLANLRGNVLPVIDARVRLSLAQAELTDSSRVLVIDTGKVLTGVIVDAVRGVINTEDVNIEPPPEIISSGVDTRYIERVLKLDEGRKMVMQLDIDALCAIELQGASSKEHGPGQQKVEEDLNAAAGIDEMQLVTFLVAHEEYGFPIASVREVLRIGRVTEVPEAPPYVMGIFSVRNSLLPIIDIRRLFGSPSLVEEMGRELGRMERSHQNWMQALGQSLENDTTFTGVIDPSACDLGCWFEGFRTSSEKIGRAIQDLRFVHQRFHALAEQVQHIRRAETLEIARGEFAEASETLLRQFGAKMENLKSSIGESIDEDQRILVIEVGRMPVGILVDRMQQVIRVPEDIIDAPPAILSTERSESLRGIVKLDQGRRLILLLHEDKVLSGERRKELKNMADPVQEKVRGEAKAGLQDDELQLVTFRLGSEEYALGIEDVQEINRLEQITSVPRAPSFVEGVMNLRGNVIPAIDLRKRFGLEVVDHSEQSRVIIVNMRGRLTGFIVDSVSEVLRMSRKAIEQPPEVIAGDVQTDFIRGIGKTSNDRMLLLIDSDKMLSVEEQKELKRTTGGGQSSDPEEGLNAGKDSPSPEDDGSGGDKKLKKAR